MYDSLSEASGATITPQTLARRAARRSPREAGVEVPPHATHGKLVEELWEHFVKGGLERPTFVMDFPLDTSPLVREHRSIAGVVEKWDLYVRGFELATGYSELVDPVIQRERFVEQAKLAARRRPRGDAPRRGVPARARARHAAVGRHGHGHRPPADGDHRPRHPRDDPLPARQVAAATVSAAGIDRAAAGTPSRADARRARTSGRSRRARARARSRTRARVALGVRRAAERPREPPARREGSGPRRRGARPPRCVGRARARRRAGRDRAARPPPTSASRGGSGTPRPTPSAAARRAPRRRRARPPHHCTRAMSRSAGRRGTRRAPPRRTARGRRHPTERLLEERRQIIERCRPRRAPAGRRGVPLRRADRSPRPGSSATAGIALPSAATGTAAPRRTAAATASLERAQRARGALLLGEDRPPGAPIPAAWSPSGDGEVRALARRLVAEFVERRARVGAVGVEVRAPRVRGDAQGIGHTHAAGIGALLERLGRGRVRHPVVGEARVGVGDRRDGIGLGERHTMPMRVAATRSTRRRRRSSGRSKRIAPRLRVPANGMSTRLRVGR